MKEIKSKVFNTECQILIQINKEATFGLEKAIFGFVGPGLSRTDNYLLTDPLIIDLVWDTPDRPDSRLVMGLGETDVVMKTH